MELTNSYYWFKEALTPEQCQKIIDLGTKQIEDDKKSGISTDATTRGFSHKQGLEKDKGDVISQSDKTVEELKKEKEKLDNVYIRDSEISWLVDQWLYDLVYPYLHEANEKAGWKYDFDFSEPFQFTKYGLNQFYGWHADGLGDHCNTYRRFIPGVHEKDSRGNYPTGYTENHNIIGKVRKLSMTINLNKPGEYEGGNLKFDYGPHSEGERYHECTEIRPQGSIIIFPSFIHHQVTPVTKGTRYSLVLWSVGPPFK
jgi:PKHD-type hydroxylase